MEEQKMWLMGQYIRGAIASVQGYTISIPLMDDKSIKKVKPQEYPKCPHLQEVEPVHDEAWFENENRKFMAWISSIKPLE